MGPRELKEISVRLATRQRKARELKNKNIPREARRKNIVAESCNRRWGMKAQIGKNIGCLACHKAAGGQERNNSILREAQENFVFHQVIGVGN